MSYPNSDPDRLNATFMALADSTRRAILARLACGEASVSELAEPFAMSQPAVSKHLKVLERAELISVARDGQRRPRRIEAGPLAEARDWLERYREIWEASFERLDALLEDLQAVPKARASAKTPTKPKKAKPKEAKPKETKPKKTTSRKRNGRKIRA